MTGIAAVAACIPDGRRKVGELPERAELGEAQTGVYDRLGIETVAVAGDRSAGQLAAQAARTALERAGLVADDLDAIVSVQPRVPEYLMVSDATRLQDDIGAARALTFGVGDLGCVSINAALILAGALLRANPAWRHVLVAHGSTPPGPRRYRHPVTISGDGAVAAVLASQGGSRILDEALETNGAYWDLYRIDFKDRPTAEWVEACASMKRYSFELAIESRNRFRALNDAVLARQQLTYGDVDHFVMQNVSEGAFSFYEEFLGIAFARACRDNLREHGHLGSADILLNLQRGIDSGEFRQGHRVLVMNNSPVAAWSTLLVEV